MIAQLDQNDLVLLTLQLALLIPQYFFGAANLLLNFLLERAFVDEFWVALLHVPNKGEGLVEAFYTALNHLCILVLLLLAHLDACLTQSQVSLEVTRVEIDGCLCILAH